MWSNNLKVCCLFLLTSLSAWAAPSQVTQLFLEHYIQNNTLSVHAKARITLSPAMVDALKHGVPLYFLSRIELREPILLFGLIPYQRTVTQHTTLAQLRFNPLNQRWHLINENKQRHLKTATLAEALEILGTFDHLSLIDTQHLHPGIPYRLAWRITLDRDKLPIPLWLTTLYDASWQLDSGWLIKPVDVRKLWQR